MTVPKCPLFGDLTVFAKDLYMWSIVVCLSFLMAISLSEIIRRYFPQLIVMDYSYTSVYGCVVVLMYSCVRCTYIHSYAGM